MQTQVLSHLPDDQSSAEVGTIFSCQLFAKHRLLTATWLPRRHRVGPSASLDEQIRQLFGVYNMMGEGCQIKICPVQRTKIVKTMGAMYTHSVSIHGPKDHHTGNVSPEFALLGFLVAGPSHGYDLHQRFIAELGQVWHLSQSQAYAILKRLEGRGDISVQVIEQEKLPARQMLQITEAGRRRFFDWLELGIGRNARSIRLEFLTRLYFTQLHRAENISRIYQAQVAEIRSTIVRLESLLDHLPPEQIFNRLSLDLRLRQMRLIQNWMAEISTQFHIPGK